MRFVLIRVDKNYNRHTQHKGWLPHGVASQWGHPACWCGRLPPCLSKGHPMIGGAEYRPHQIQCDAPPPCCSSGYPVTPALGCAL